MFRFLSKLTGVGAVCEQPSRGGVSTDPRQARVQRQHDHLIALFKQAYQAACTETKSQYILLEHFANFVYRLDPAFSPKANGFRKFALLVESIGLFDVARDGLRQPKIKLKRQP